MYDLPYHKENNDQVVREFIRDHPFAVLTGCGPEGWPVATQAPVFMEERDGRMLLSGHIMKNTDHHRALQHNGNVLVVFSGAHSYVSATWYSNPNMASTWNYMSVHVKGVVRFLDGAGLEAVLRKTSLRFENFDHQSPTVFDNLPADFKNNVMKAIVGFEIEVTEVDTVFKLSQDRDLKSYLNIIDKLKEQGESGRAVAIEMEKRTKELFPED